VRWVLVVVVLVLVLPAGCGGGGRSVRGAGRGEILTVACAVPRSLARAPLPQDTGVYRARPLSLVTGEDLARIPRRRLRSPSGSEIGKTLYGCPARDAHTQLSRSALPFLGVACSPPNSVACDRVGVGVHLKAAAALVTVSVAGRLVTLNPPLDPPDDLWYGYLSDAGLSHGPLDVHRPLGGRWAGTPEVYAPVQVTAVFADGSATSLHAVEPLHPGFG
jgi:hypothetical protein